ncbi:hypothetical protein J3R30DRAFT_3404082 [Lentinula aciculospora]|uniref:Uncharacterized protein n=1 Tax=Lentinula aciculospora TaxID=153920 RepID=A0A9W9ABZ7_9AGAR|nr:hypothetical protein J3R30DRAFT_3404082 [Lentinula aciculospora]
MNTNNPLTEQKTEIYYADDDRRDAGPSVEELARFGVKVRDFGFERWKGKGVGWKGKEIVLIERQFWGNRNGSGVGGNGERSQGLHRRQKVFRDLEELEQSVTQPLSSESELEGYIETPTVTPNGSLHWKDATFIPTTIPARGDSIREGEDLSLNLLPMKTTQENRRNDRDWDRKYYLLPLLIVHHHRIISVVDVQFLFSRDRVSGVSPERGRELQEQVKIGIALEWR